MEPLIEPGVSNSGSQRQIDVTGKQRNRPPYGSTSTLRCESTFKLPVLGRFGWNRGGATGGKGSVRRAPENGLNQAKLLPPAAPSRGLDRMVRRGSPVRVRKRASRKSCTAAFSAARLFAYVPQRSVVELFLEHVGCVNSVGRPRSACLQGRPSLGLAFIRSSHRPCLFDVDRASLIFARARQPI